MFATLGKTSQGPGETLQRFRATRALKASTEAINPPTRALKASTEAINPPTRALKATNKTSRSPINPHKRKNHPSMVDGRFFRY
ncbi:hypothetical protein FITA111629_05780 [Filibacter tadaridae]|uniref:Uncharacterized protein n=1 Tax=Filibacter tadaridae TaxID=2483811 RepID=A0A3P5WVI7_9BACL|nr:hypothetical protein FILTAD_00305 [Filibacter tadaridae]